MVFSLLLRSNCSSEVHDKVSSEVGSEDNSQIGKVPTAPLSSSVPRLLAGYEDGSICYYDIRTFRWYSTAFVTSYKFEFEVHYRLTK
jgi:hypothetical protein